MEDFDRSVVTLSTVFVLDWYPKDTPSGKKDGRILRNTPMGQPNAAVQPFSEWSETCLAAEVRSDEQLANELI